MALLNAYLYLLLIDLANFHTWKLDDTSHESHSSLRYINCVTVRMRSTK